MLTGVLTGPALGSAVAGLRHAVELLRASLATGGDGDPALAVELLKLAQATDGLALRQVASVELFATASSMGHHSTAALVAAATGAAHASARSTVVLAERLSGDLRPVGSLLEAGRITRAHAHAIRHGLRGLDAATVADVLPAVCDAALLIDPTRLDRELRERAQALSPTLADEARRRLDARVGVSLDELPDGSGHLRGTLSPECLATLRPLLDSLVFSGERDPADTRQVTRRRHDALLTLARHASDCSSSPVPARGSSRARIVITASLATVRDLPGAPAATIAGNLHALLTREQLLRHTCDADLHLLARRAGTHRLDLGRAIRTATDPQWLALMTRDRHCAIAGCYRPPSQCQAHHAIHWAHGGPSDLHNLVLLCHHHHHAVHDQQATLTSHDGRALSPAGWASPTSSTDPGPPR